MPYVIGGKNPQTLPFNYSPTVLQEQQYSSEGAATVVEEVAGEKWSVQVATGSMSNTLNGAKLLNLFTVATNKWYGLSIKTPSLPLNVLILDAAGNTVAYQRYSSGFLFKSDSAGIRVFLCPTSSTKVFFGKINVNAVSGFFLPDESRVMASADLIESSDGIVIQDMNGNFITTI